MLMSVRYWPGTIAEPNSPLSVQRVFTAYWKDVLSCASAGVDAVSASPARQNVIDREREVCMTSSRVRNGHELCAGRNAHACTLWLYTRKFLCGRAENPFCFACHE